MKFAVLLTASVLSMASALPFGGALTKNQLTPKLSISAPGKLRQMVENGDGVHAPKGMSYWMLKSGEAVYTVQTVPKDSTDSEEQILADYAMSLSKPGGGRLLHHSDIRLGKLKAVEWEFENAMGMHARWVAAVAGDRIISAGVTWRSPAHAPTDAGAYLHSLSIAR